tara:strand:- start:1005 stop:2720 length:1716 start_codon:yes stop_codon:yes gene_type:complete
MHSTPEALITARAQLLQTGSPFELTEQQQDGRRYQTYKLAPTSVREALAVGRQHGDNLFLQYQDEDWSFNQFFNQVDAIAFQLINRYKINKGDRVAIAMRNFPEWMTVYTAVTSLGAVVVPVNSWGKKDDLVYVLTDCGAKIVFADQQRYDSIADELQALQLKAVVVRNSGAITNDCAESLEDFLADIDSDQLPELADYSFEIESSDAAMILYTSGTTGRPKGALSSHLSICQALINFEFHGAQSAMTNGKVIEKMMTSGFPSKSLLAVPLFHVSGLYAHFLLSLRGGRSINIMYKWDPTKALQVIAEQRITTLSGAPSMVLDLLEHPDFDSTDTSSLMVASGGGAASPPKMAQLIKDKISDPYPGSGYGLTETNASCCSGTGASFWYKPSSSGTLSPIIELKTIGEDGQDLPKGERGEICIRGILVASGYWNNPTATAESFIDGWFLTGDIGYLDDENFVFVVDRAKDIIIRGGENISANEVEACYLEHPAVREAAAFAVAHERLGEEVGLAVYFKEGQQASADELAAFVNGKLAHFKVAAHYWLREQPLPRNAANKVLKKQLRDDYSKL